MIEKEWEKQRRTRPRFRAENIKWKLKCFHCNGYQFRHFPKTARKHKKRTAEGHEKKGLDMLPCPVPFLDSVFPAGVGNAHVPI